MPVTDSVADMLTRIRNGLTAKHEFVEVPASNVKKAIGQILLQEGYIKGCEFIDDGVQGTLKIKLKYGPGGEKNFEGVIAGLQMQTYLCIRDFRRKKNKKGAEYGWAIAVYAMPEHLWGRDYITSAYGRDPGGSAGRVLQQCLASFPAAREDLLRKALGISGLFPDGLRQ